MLQSHKQNRISELENLYTFRDTDTLSRLTHSEQVKFQPPEISKMRKWFNAKITE